MAHVGLESWSSSVLSSSVITTTGSHKRILSLKSRSIPEEEQPFAKPRSDSRSKLPATRGEAILAKFYIVFFIIVVFLGAALFSCVAPFFPTHAIQKGVSQTVVGIIMGIMGITGFIVSWILAFTMIKIGIKFLMWTGMLITGVTAILFGVIDFCPPGPSFLVYSFICRILEGVGIAMYFNSSYTMAAILFPDTYAFIVSLLETAVSVGTLLGPSIGGALFAAGGYYLPFTVLGGILVALCPVVIIMIPENIGQGVDMSSDDTNPVLVARKMFTPAMLITAYTMLTTTIAWVFTETTLGVRLEFFNVTNPLIVGSIYLASSGAYAFVAPIVGRISDRTSYAWLIMLIGCVFLVIGYLVIGPSPILLNMIIPESLVQLIIGCLCTHSGLAAVIIPTTKELQRQAELTGLNPSGMGTLIMITALFQSIWLLGGFFGSVISSAMMEYLGYGWASTAQAGIVLTAFFLQFYTIFKHGMARQCLAKCKGYDSVEDHS